MVIHVTEFFSKGAHFSYRLMHLYQRNKSRNSWNKNVVVMLWQCIHLGMRDLSKYRYNPCSLLHYIKLQCPHKLSTAWYTESWNPLVVITNVPGKDSTFYEEVRGVQHLIPYCKWHTWCVQTRINKQLSKLSHF